MPQNTPCTSSVAELAARWNVAPHSLKIETQPIICRGGSHYRYTGWHILELPLHHASLIITFVNSTACWLGCDMSTNQSITESHACHLQSYHERETRYSQGREPMHNYYQKKNEINAKIMSCFLCFPCCPALRSSLRSLNAPVIPTPHAINQSWQSTVKIVAAVSA